MQRPRSRTKHAVCLYHNFWGKISNAVCFFKKFIYLFIYLFMAVLGLRCCTQSLSSCSKRGILFVAVRGLLIAVASLVVEHRLQVCGLQQLWRAGSVVVARRLSSCGARAQLLHGMRDLPRPGLEPVSPALAGRFLTTAPPGKSSTAVLKHVQFSFFLNRNLLFIYLFNSFILAALGLRCCAWAFSSCGERRLLFVAVHRLLIAVASLTVEHGLQARGLQQLRHSGSVVVAHGLQSTGSVVVAHGLSCSAACGIFPDQGSNPCPLHWQADS